MTAPRRYRLTAAQRLKRDVDFRAVLDARATKRVGPLVVHAKPNGLDFSRLGIRIGRRVGSAPERNRVKRLLREAFRLMQHDWPCGYDIIVSVRSHDDTTLAEYQRLLFGAVRSLHLLWDKRLGRDNADGC